MAWFALLLWGRRGVSQVRVSPWVAGVAFALFAFDEARAATIAWLCNRNALIALAFGVWALLAHDRARADGDRRAAWLAPAWFALALLGGEGALAMLGYLASYALFLDRGPLLRRAATLLPYIGVMLGWAVLYVSLGYGASGSGFYIDPVREPLVFLRMLPERLTIYTVAMFEGVSADWYNVAPLFGWNPRPTLLPISAALVGLLCVAFAPLVLAPRGALLGARRADRAGAHLRHQPVRPNAHRSRARRHGAALAPADQPGRPNASVEAALGRVYAGVWRWSTGDLAAASALSCMIGDFDAALARADVTCSAAASELTVVL